MSLQSWTSSCKSYCPFKEFRQPSNPFRSDALKPSRLLCCRLQMAHYTVNYCNCCIFQWYAWVAWVLLRVESCTAFFILLTFEPPACFLAFADSLYPTCRVLCVQARYFILKGLEFHKVFIFWFGRFAWFFSSFICGFSVWLRFWFISCFSYLMWL